MDVGSKILELERRIRELETLLRSSAYEERPAKIRDVMNLRRMVEMEYVQKRDLTDLVYTKEECDKQFRKRSMIDRILETREE